MQQLDDGNDDFESEVFEGQLIAHLPQKSTKLVIFVNAQSSNRVSEDWWVVSKKTWFLKIAKGANFFNGECVWNDIILMKYFFALNMNIFGRKLQKIIRFWKIRKQTKKEFFLKQTFRPFEKHL